MKKKNFKISKFIKDLLSIKETKISKITNECKFEIIKEISKNFDIPNKKAQKVFDTFFEVLKESIFEFGEIKVKGLGKFKIVKQESKKCYNFYKKEEIITKEKNVIKFLQDSNFNESKKIISKDLSLNNQNDSC